MELLSFYNKHKKSIIIASTLISLVGLLLIGYLLLKDNVLRSPANVASWYDNNYQYRKGIDVNNDSGYELVNEDVLIELDTASLISAGKMQADCDDIRFADSDDSTVLNYWVEGGCNTAKTQIWVEIPSLPSAGQEIYFYYGNASAENSEISWSGEFILLSDTACSGNWSRYSDFDGYFPYGSTTYGSIGSGGSHNHTYSITSSASSSTSSTGTSKTYSRGGHTHGVSGTLSTVSVLPPYLDMIFCNNSQLEDYQGLIVQTESSTLTDWTVFSALDGLFPRGADTYGGSGGQSTHAHTNSSVSVSTPSSTNTGESPDGNIRWASQYNHTHAATVSSISTESNMPPYATVYFQEADEDISSLVDTVVMTTVLPPLGWSNYTTLTDGRFPLGTTGTIATGGSLTHTHTVSGSLAADTSKASDPKASSSTSLGAYPHTHTFSDTSAEASNVPPYLSVIFAERNDSQSVTLNEEERAVPAIPTIGTPTPLTTSGIRWNFTDNADDEQGFKIYDESNNLILTCVGENLTHCDETGLSENTQYTRKVVAYNTNGNSDYSSTASAYTLVSTPSLSYGGSKTVSSIGLLGSGQVNSSELYFDCTGTSCDTGLNTWSTETTATATDLSPNTGYTFTVKGRNGDDVETETSESIEIFTLAETPTISASIVSGTSIELSLDNASNLSVGSSGVIFECTSSNCNTGINSWITTSTDTVTGLNPSTEYTFRAKARNYDGTETTYSDTITLYSGTVIPDGLILKSSTSSSVTLNLDDDSNPENSTSYLFMEENSGKYIDFSSNTLSDTPNWKLGANLPTDIVVNGLSIGQEYKFKVTTRNGDAVESGEYSEPLTVYTRLFTPTMGTPEVLSATSIKWKFTDTNTSEAGFRIYDGNGNLIKTCEQADITSCTETGLSSNTSYTRKIKTYNSSSESAYSSSATVRTPAQTASISSINILNDDSIRINISSSSTDNLQIYESSTSTYFDSSLDILAQTVRTFDAEENVTVQGLTPNTRYSFRIRSSNDNNAYTDWSSYVTAVTSARVPSVLNLERGDSNNVVRIYINNYDNPSTTQFAIQEIYSGQYLDFDDSNLSTGEVWATFGDWGGTDGILINGLDLSSQYGFRIKARNQLNIQTVFSDTEYIGVASKILNASSGLKVSLANNEETDLTKDEYAQLGEQKVRVKESNYLLADLPISFETDRDWSEAVLDSLPEQSKTVVKLTAEQGIKGAFTMYVVKGDTNAFRICPYAKTLAEVSASCIDVVEMTGDFPQTVYVEDSQVSVSQAILGGVEYWIADGLSGTGAEGYYYEESSDDTDSVVNNVVEVVKEKIPFLEQYGAWLILAFFVLLAVVGGIIFFIIWKKREKKKEK